MKTPRRCLISFASNGREAYSTGLPRLVYSALRNGHNATGETGYLIFSPDSPLSEIDGVTVHHRSPDLFKIPSHRDIPYGFKPYIFKLAQKLGFDQVIWCDSTIVIHKPLDPIWAIAEERGLFVADNPGCPISTWTSDDALDKMGCPRDASFFEIMACSLAIDFRHPKGLVVFEEWFSLCNDGVTFAGVGGSNRPDFRGHRHDQSAMSWLCQKHGVAYEPYGMLCYYGGDMQKFPNHVLVNTGLGQ